METEAEARTVRVQRLVGPDEAACKHDWQFVMGHEVQTGFAYTYRRAHWCKSCGTVEISDVHNCAIKRFVVTPNAEVHRKNCRSEAKANFSGATPCWTTRSATNPTDGDAP